MQFWIDLEHISYLWQDSSSNILLGDIIFIGVFSGPRCQYLGPTSGAGFTLVYKVIHAPLFDKDSR